MIKASNALHVTLRVSADIVGLRGPALYKAFREATALVARRDDFRIVHLSIQRTHLHLIVEADSKRALGRGMQSFQISAARKINALLGRRGRVFADRYHLVVIRSPTQMRNVLSYVLNNWRKHRDDRGTPRAWLVDPYSSGFAFPGWSELERGRAMWPAGEGYDWLVVRPARAWVLTTGWRLAGQVSAFAVPGSRPD